MILPVTMTACLGSQECFNSALSPIVHMWTWKVQKSVKYKHCWVGAVDFMPPPPQHTCWRPDAIHLFPSLWLIAHGGCHEHWTGFFYLEASDPVFWRPVQMQPSERLRGATWCAAQRAHRFAKPPILFILFKVFCCKTELTHFEMLV